jgi:hypothetical protein
VRNFTCQCGATIYFENIRCLSCGRALGFDPARLQLLSLEAETGQQWRAADGAQFHLCRNHVDYHVCNWLVADPGASWCLSCRLNHTIPDLGNPANLRRWHVLETAKRRLLYSLLSLGLPVSSRAEDPEHGLAFMFLEDGPAPLEGERLTHQRIQTGHSYGTITINLAETDPASREQMREQMNETYRTVLGHFRHEIGHYYWEPLIARGERLQAFRATFGDERADYDSALSRYYEQGPAPDWPQHFVSAYASAHPWEDWAETWAHYLHMLDTVETAEQYQLTCRDNDDRQLPKRDFNSLREHWIELTLALNALNRSMGLPDAYPFALAPQTQEKLRFVHRLVRSEQPARHNRHAS